MTEIVIEVEGMTCASCERRVESAASRIEGVATAKADAARKSLSLGLAGGVDAMDAVSRVAKAVNAAGYDAHARNCSVPRRRFLPGRDTALALGIGTGIAATLFALERSGIGSFAPRQGATIVALAASGLLASFHCISMCGGIALSQALRSGTATVSRWASLGSTIAYNTGRVAGYTAIGAIIGALGASFDLGTRGRAAIMFVAAVFMAAMGLRLAGLMPPAHRREGSVFARLKDAASSRAASLGPFAVGLANSLMPCGPLQAAQAFALASGSAATGAASMLAFSLGTVPLMVAFGAGGSMLSVRFRSVSARAGGVLILFLGLAAFGRAWALSGMGVPSFGASSASVLTANAGIEPAAGRALTAGPAANPSAGPIVATEQDDYQEVTFDLSARSYRRFIVAAGKPVRWTIRAAASSLNGCNQAIVVPAYGLSKNLVPGDNLIEFMPGQAGTVQYSCWMGMIRSSIEVVAPDDPRMKITGELSNEN